MVSKLVFAGKEIPTGRVAPAAVRGTTWDWDEECMDGEKNPPPGSAPPAGQNVGAILSGFLAGDTGQKILMLLVVLGGGSNILNTNSASKVNQDEIKQAVEEIHHLHDALDPITDRQKRIEDLLNQMAKK
jgi:hypothetical protein